MVTLVAAIPSVYWTDALQATMTVKFKCKILGSNNNHKTYLLYARHRQGASGLSNKTLN